MEGQVNTPKAEGATKVYETTISVVAEPKGMLAPDPGNATPLDAHHKMLHEGSILSSHFKAYQAAITKYTASAAKFMHAADDFILSAGQPAKYEHKLTPEGQAAVAAAAAAAGSGAARAAAPAGADEAAAAEPSAFEADAAQPSTLPLQGPVAGYFICPSMPGSPALGAAALTHTAPADILLPAQHEVLFRHDVQRKLIAAGSGALTAALQEKLAPAFKVWLDAYEECKLLSEVERLRRDADAALNRLQQAKRKVLEAEASLPLVSGQQLQEAGQMPRVLVQVTAGGLVATPDVQQRQEMYQREKEYTDASLAFELAEKVLRDKLGWLMQAGAGLKGAAAAALGHALVAAAAEGQSGQAASGTAAVGGSQRAPREELLEPFPAHVLARLSGQHLPTLQQLVLADAHRLGRWGQRCRAAIAAAAGAAAAAAGAQMLAAAAAPPGAATGLPVGDVVPPAEALQGLARTDSDPAVQQQAGVAAGQSTTAGSTSGVDSPGVPDAAAAAAAAAVPAGSAAESAGGPAAPPAAAGMVEELQQAAAAANVPLDLLAAAVAADVQEREAAQAAASRDDAAWHLLHDASVVAAKEEAVLLPAVREHLGREPAEVLKQQHKDLAAALANLGQQSPAAAAFDLALVEVLDVVDQHVKELEFNILPALAAAPGLQLRTQQDLARQYRRAAAAAPTRPHGWFLGTSDTTAAERGGAGGVMGAASAAVAATKDALRRVAAAPVKAGVAAVDAAADVARFGRGHVPDKL